MLCHHGFDKVLPVSDFEPLNIAGTNFQGPAIGKLFGEAFQFPLELVFDFR